MGISKGPPIRPSCTFVAMHLSTLMPCACLYTYTYACLHTCLPTYLLACLDTCMHMSTRTSTQTSSPKSTHVSAPSGIWACRDVLITHV